MRTGCRSLLVGPALSRERPKRRATPQTPTEQLATSSEATSYASPPGPGGLCPGDDTTGHCRCQEHSAARPTNLSGQARDAARSDLGGHPKWPVPARRLMARRGAPYRDRSPLPPSSFWQHLPELAKGPPERAFRQVGLRLNVGDPLVTFPSVPEERASEADKPARRQVVLSDGPLFVSRWGRAGFARGAGRVSGGPLPHPMPLGFI